MKKILLFGLVGLIGLFFTNCTKDLQNNTEGTLEGGYVTVDNANINYVVGDGGAYSFNLFAHQNIDYDIVKINIYKSAEIFSASEKKLLVSNEILSESINVAGTDRLTVTSKKYAYTDLINGLTIGGNPLPASDGQLSIGDKFVFRIESELANGNKVQQSFKVNMVVSTRYAGTYICTDLKYYRLGVLSPSYWLDAELVIKSIDAITYEYDWGSTIGWTGPLYFQVDGDGNITYPAEWNGKAQVLNGQPLITCDRNLSDLANVPCNGSNKVIKDDINGKDQLILTYGYYTAGSGPREFTETLVKK
jgi:hypothetical protein